MRCLNETEKTKLKSEDDEMIPRLIANITELKEDNGDIQINEEAKITDYLHSKTIKYEPVENDLSQIDVSNSSPSKLKRNVESSTNIALRSTKTLNKAYYSQMTDESQK